MYIRGVLLCLAFLGRLAPPSFVIYESCYTLPRAWEIVITGKTETFSQRQIGTPYSVAKPSHMGQITIYNTRLDHDRYHRSRSSRCCICRYNILCRICTVQTQPRKTCARSCRSYGSHPAASARSYISDVCRERSRWRSGNIIQIIQFICPML